MQFNSFPISTAVQIPTVTYCKLAQEEAHFQNDEEDLVLDKDDEDATSKFQHFTSFKTILTAGQFEIYLKLTLLFSTKKLSLAWL